MNLENTYKEIVLDRLEFCIRNYTEFKQVEYLKSIGEFKSFQDFDKNALVNEMRLFIYGKEHPEKNLVKYPSNWWESVKERFAPPWFLRKFPVEYTKIYVKFQELYPDLKVDSPKETPYLKIIFREEDTF
jgi:hypothetical protein